MIKIESASGETLYVAENAQDVRSAVEEAARKSRPGAPHLFEANLEGANLEGANLGETSLEGAYLEGANLGRANLGWGVWTEVAEKLQESVAAMNDSGRHWIKGAFSQHLADGTMAYCSIGAIEAKADGTTLAIASWLLSSVCGGSISHFNDDKNTTWEDVQDVFSVAIKHAERFARRARG